MILNGDTALAVFKKVKHIREHYRSSVLGPDMNRVSIEDLHVVISDMYDITIEKRQVVFESQFIRGLMERYQDKIIIRVRQDQTDDWKRFTAAKEMCHVVIDEEEDWSTDGVATLTDLLFEHSLQNGDEAHRVTQSEIFAEIAAMELLYPFDVRNGDRDKIAQGTTTTVKIATEHGMPVSLVSRALSDAYHEELAMPLWKELEDCSSEQM